jgi:hypothetical protein
MKRALLLIAALMVSIVPPAVAAARTSLTITADLQDGASAYTWTLTCDPVGGKHPNRKAACAIIAKQGTKLFVPVPPDAACTMIYGGAEQVKVRGTIKGKKVNAVFTRSNGCEIARYDKAQALFTIPGTQVLRGNITLDDQPADGQVIFLSGRRQVNTTAVAGAFAVRLGEGTWLGSSGLGRSCTPVTVVVPSEPTAPLIACRTVSTG